MDRKKRPTEILKELKVGQDWLLNNIKARKLSYFGHLKRHDSLEKHILEARLEGKRRKGRPTRRWTEDIIRVFYFEFHKLLCFADSDLPYKKKLILSLPPSSLFQVLSSDLKTCLTPLSLIKACNRVFFLDRK